MDNSPNSNTTDVYRSNKNIWGLGKASGNASPSFQDQKTVFYWMSQFIEIFVIATLFFAVFLRWNHGFHPCWNRICQNIICVITSVRQQSFCRNAASLTILLGIFCNKDSDWHTMRIHGQMYFSVRPSFVLDISWLTPFAPDAWRCTFIWLASIISRS